MKDETREPSKYDPAPSATEKRHREQMSVQRWSLNLAFVSTALVIASVAVAIVSTDAANRAAEASIASVEEAKAARIDSSRAACVAALVQVLSISATLILEWNSTEPTDLDGGEVPIADVVVRSPEVEKELLQSTLGAWECDSPDVIPDGSQLAEGLGERIEDVFYALTLARLRDDTAEEKANCIAEAVYAISDVVNKAAEYVDNLREGESEPATFEPAYQRCRFRVE